MGSSRLFLLPSAYVVCGKVMFSVMCVCSLFTEAGIVPPFHYHMDTWDPLPHQDPIDLFKPQRGGWHLTLLPPANEVWGKLIFLHLSVILFTGGRGVHRQADSSTAMSWEAVLTYFVYFRQLHSNEWGSCAHILCLFQTVQQQWVGKLFSHILCILDSSATMSEEAFLTNFVYFRQLHNNEWGSCSHILCLFQTAPKQWVGKLFSHKELNEAVLNTLFILDTTTAMSEEAVLMYFVYFRQLNNNEWGSCSHILCLFQTVSQQWVGKLCSHTLFQADSQQWVGKLCSHTLSISGRFTAMNGEAVLTYFVYFRQIHSNEWGSCAHILCLFQADSQQWMGKLFSHTLSISGRFTAMSGEAVLTYFVYFR